MAMSKQRRALAAALEALDRADMNGLPGLTPAYIAIGEALAELEQSTAVEPAQAAIKCKEPAQAVPFAWVLECMTSIGTTCWMLSWNRSGVGSCNRLHGQDHEKPLYTAPPAIDDETRKMALLIREAVNKGIFQGAMHMDAISILSRLTIFHGGENDSSR